ncbi:MULTISPECIES: nuclear transport factor 2 family protein [Amycolatopsis]|uniref:nuclear transport factor 2 family protein n=1 Tax=Amycolatopsis TaxID=1813 RepID=UPI00106FD926|nr:nuclear transport factor 2 family protein [Amycolatopsis nivea]
MDRIAQLEARLARLEDEREISRLIAAYGPLVDAGAAEDVAALWTEDGAYDVDEIYLEGREQLARMVRSSAHQGWISGGCAHFVGPPHVTVDGDTAIAVCHSLMVVYQDDRFVIRRATANHWALARTDEGWKVTRRTNRVLDGRAESPGLLRQGAYGEPAFR